MKKRYENRMDVKLPVELISSGWDEPVCFESRDFTPRGTYLVSELMPDLDEDIVCSFNLPGRSNEFCFFAKVSRVNLMRRETDIQLPGFGVSFLDTTAIDRLIIRNTLGKASLCMPGKSRGREHLRYKSTDFYSDFSRIDAPFF